MRLLHTFLRRKTLVSVDHPLRDQRPVWMAMQWGAFGQAPVQMVFRTFSDGSGSGSSLHTFLRRNENEVQVRFRSSLRGLDHRICIRARCWPSIDMNFYQGHTWRNIQFLYRYQSLTLYFRSNVNTLEHLVILEHVKDKVVRHQPVHNPRLAHHQNPPNFTLEPVALLVYLPLKTPTNWQP